MLLTLLIILMALVAAAGMEGKFQHQVMLVEANAMVVEVLVMFILLRLLLAIHPVAF